MVQNKRAINKEKRVGNIAKAIRLVIDSNLFVKEAIVKGIVNYSALADIIKEEVMKIADLKKPISKDSIVAATIRYSKGLDTKSVSKDIIKNVANITFSVKTDIRLLSIPKKNIKRDDFLKIYEKFELESGEQLIVFQGIKDIILVSDDPNYEFLLKHFSNKIEILQENLALFIIHSEGIPQYIPGYLEFFTSKLASRGINIEIYSSKEDLILLIDEKDVGDVYNLLNDTKLKAQQVMKFGANL